MTDIRVRFAPSPTGMFHVGSARTFIFNWLYARHNQGTMVLRLDDTDVERNTDASVQSIFEGLRWLGLTWDDIDLVELNEAFAPQVLAVLKGWGWDDRDRLNVNGSGISLGHPIGASGARVLVTLLHEMIRRDAHRGIAALCLGGGNSVALAVDR